MGTHTSQTTHAAPHTGTPQDGPALLFFSGGTALRDTARELVRHTHNCVHVITPFDSGGSSAVLRRAFGMPAVGDIRNRLMALADQTLEANATIFELFAHRLDSDAGPASLRTTLREMATGAHPLVRAVPRPQRDTIQKHLSDFLGRMPRDFDLRGASIGNLALVAGYLDNNRDLAPPIRLFTRLVKARGVVRPVTPRDLHLAVELEDGQVLAGQHRFTGKEYAPIPAPVHRIWLTADLHDPAPVSTEADAEVLRLVERADLICYPVGSFYSSVVANLLPDGVARAVAAADCPKVFTPNTGTDPESPGMSVAARVRVLRETMGRTTADPANCLDAVLVDPDNGAYPGGLGEEDIAAMGVEVIRCRLVTPRSAPLADPELLARALLRLSR